MQRTLSLAFAAATLFAAAAPLPSQSAGQIPGSATSQPTPTPAPGWALNAFSLSSATVQDLATTTRRTPFRFTVVLGDRPTDIYLAPNDVRAADFQLLVDDGTRISALPRPASVTWRGHVVGAPESVVAASIVDGQMEAVISLASGEPLWGIQSLHSVDPRRPVSQHIVYSTANSTVQHAVCGTDDSAWKASAPQAGPEARKVAEIALDADFDYYQRSGSNTTSVTNAVTQVINGVDAIYQRDTDIEYSVTTIIVRTSRTYNNSDMRRLLPEFRSRWNNSHNNIQRDVAHLFTGKGSFSGIVGIAYLGVICNTSNSYGVDKAFSSLGTNVGLVAHELGHNWNAPHCDGANPCNIMCSGLGGCNRNLSSFGSSSQNVIVNFKNSRSCLDDPGPSNPPTINSVSPSTVSVRPSQGVTLSGTDFTGATQVTVGGTPLGFFRVVDDQTITFLSPVPSTLNNVPVQVDNNVGSSNTVNLDFTPADPPLHSAPPFTVSNSLLSFTMAGDPMDNWFLLVSFDDTTTFPFQGFDVLQNNLTLGTGALDQVGFDTFDFQVPAVNLAGVTLSSQVVMLDENSGALNFVTSFKDTAFLQ